MNNKQKTDCPEEEILQDMAAGIADQETVIQYASHIADCGRCQSLLKRYLSEFSDELDARDTAILAGLKTSKPDWQKKFIREQIIGKKVPTDPVWIPTPVFWRRMILFAGAPAVVLLATLTVGPVLLTTFNFWQGQKKVSQAFFEDPIETRFARAPFSTPRRPELGGDSPEPVALKHRALNKAADFVADHLESKDPRWLQLQARVSLLQGNAEEAENFLMKARKRGLQDPSLEIDLASAYFEEDRRAYEKEGTSAAFNLERTINLLTEVLSRRDLTPQERSAALYNLAIAYEKISDWRQAVDTWKLYLESDPSGLWAEQVRKKLRNAESKLRTSRDYSKPTTLLDLKVQDLRPEDAEQFQQKAMGTWILPALKEKNSDDYRALKRLSETLDSGHGDPWLKDFLSVLKPGDLPAVQKLSSAVVSNESGLFDQALEQSQAAARNFARRRSTPGELFARFAEIYALRNLLRSSDCLSRADQLKEKLANTKYHWLQAQLYLETAQCQNFRGELAKSNSNSFQSQEIAERYFPVLKLRILGISASMNHQQGKCDKAWAQATEGLAHYWDGTFPGDRLDQFYAVMWQCARDTGSLWAATAFLRESLALREEPRSNVTKNSIREGMLHQHLANILKVLKENDLADIEARKASSKLQAITEKYAQEYRLTTFIEPAELALRKGDAKGALATLEPVSALLRTTEDNFIILTYYRLMGDIKLEMKQYDEAAAAYEEAIKIADTSLASLQDGPDRLNWLRATDASYRGLVRVLLKQDQPRQALERWERYKSLPLVQGEPVSDIHLSLAENRPGAQNRTTASSLPWSRGTRLIYAIFRDGLQIWLVRDRSIQSRWISVQQSDLELKVRDFAELLANPKSDIAEVSRQGQALYAILLAPLMSELTPGETLIVEPDKSAYNLPLQALQFPDGRYVAERFPLLSSPGIWMEENRLRRPIPINSQATVLLVDASHLPSQEDLELKAIQEAFPRTRIADSRSASWDDLRSRLATSEVIHVMSHGIKHGSGTELLFRDNKPITAADFTAGLFHRSQLVVLAACSTGRGEKDGMLDTDSLVRSVLSAGVPRVVASHWNVDSDSTALLMSRFYRHLARNPDAARAMYEARNETMQMKVSGDSVDYSHPYYWAGFSLTGRAP